jgi:hypothetical protein
MHVFMHFIIILSVRFLHMRRIESQPYARAELTHLHGRGLKDHAHATTSRHQHGGVEVHSPTCALYITRIRTELGPRPAAGARFPLGTRATSELTSG